MKYEVKETTFGELLIGTMFAMPIKSETYWFKQSTRTAIGTKPSQGPLGRNWDNFSKDDKVRGEVPIV